MTCKKLHLTPLALLLIAALPARATDVTIYPDQQKQLITDWGFDIKQPGKAALVTPDFARTLFVEDKMNVLRVAIYGDEQHPAHPADGQVDGTYYQDTLTAMANARQARPDVLLFASKRLENTKTFPAWVLDANGVIPDRYAHLLADYLAYMEAHGFPIDLLGLDNEMEWNKGNITPAKARAIEDDLKALSQSRGFKMPKLIAPETFEPNPEWMTEADKLGVQMDFAGTHYYPYRPYDRLQAFVQAAGSRPLWNTEVHTGNPKHDDLIETTLATFFDCTDSGFSGFVWWSYARTRFANGLERAMTQSTAETRPVGVSDEGHEYNVAARVIVRAFRGDNQLAIWAINGTDHDETCQFHLASGKIGGDVAYEQWAQTTYANGTITPTSQTLFEFTLPTKTGTKFILPFPTASAAKSP